MRDIKFRAWDKNGLRILKVRSLTMDGQSVCFNQPGDAIVLSDKEAIFMQYTGLKDKNGKEIYEGDVVHFAEFYNAGGIDGYREGENQHTLPVEFDNNLAGWSVGDWWLGVMCQQDDELEVIGNIYENKELLK